MRICNYHILGFNLYLYIKDNVWKGIVVQLYFVIIYKTALMLLTLLYFKSKLKSVQFDFET